MNRLLSSLVVLSSLLTCFGAHASTIYAKITGDRVEWSNAALNGSEIQPLQWQPSDKFNMLPIKKWSPAFYQNTQKSLTFHSKAGAELKTSFKHTGIDFRTSIKPVQMPGVIGNSQRCDKQLVYGNDIRLRSKSTCGADFILDQLVKHTPFDFYRPSFELPSLVSDFMQSKLPAGRYIASFSQSIAYYLIYENNQVESYQIYQDQVELIIDYQPSFLESVQVLGDGKFNVEYDTDNNTAKGDTSYRVHVKGYITPGIKMSFESSGQKDDFSLVDHKSNSKIPYDLTCDVCVAKQVIQEGVMDKDFARIDFEGQNLEFNLDFSFNNLHYGDVDEGDFSDAVTVIFEIDI
ncbi:hypothetical protein [Vibrio campbellii]|uniref:Fimbrial protein n=1 Tax=Vibrio campbellii (strain ATCC BAA-1116) TaxID=2902295 RepID=A7MTJ2_VIBC1|nr:hypothetical protein [Vibrio campbellii]ABU70623.1 hypothetical protein VIBHAR_01654 [Vibrio campbellii ATCC BAA-1116]AGU96345.1 hypothetical protein M892_04860 [Vibrio campbellii ATCC BAA-1116]MBT0124090.1 hypothetical protein [Vibrio campbellii]MBT0139042.1 hypothetical protein [Vibrio campbellii]MBT0143731.1 hypothetical protein [Vibrio campbellii]